MLRIAKEETVEGIYRIISRDNIKMQVLKLASYPLNMRELNSSYSKKV